MQGARVLLSGYYGFGNLGDEALLSGLSGALQRRGVSVTVLSADPAATRASHGVSARHRVTGLLPGVLAADAVDDAAADDTSWSSMRALARDIARQMDTAVR